MTNLNQQLREKIISILSGAEKPVKDEDLSIKVYENSSSVQYTLEEFFNQYNPEEIAKGQCNLIFRFDLGKNTIASFQLKDMYNCCGIIVGSELFVHKGYRNKGLGGVLTKFMIDFSTYYGYGVLQGADRKDNEHQIKIFEKLGWECKSEFINPKTQNVLKMWLFNLSENKNVPQDEN